MAVPHHGLRLGVGAYAHEVLDTGEVAVATRVVKRSVPIVGRQVDEVGALLLDDVLEDVEVAVQSSQGHRRTPRGLLSCKEARREKRKEKKTRKRTRGAQHTHHTPQGEKRKEKRREERREKRGGGTRQRQEAERERRG